MRAIKLFGDPMMPCVVGLTEGFINSGKDVVLAGGTQMGAVAAVLKELNLSDDLVLATTKYVFDDTSARFIELIEALEIDAFSAYPDFSKSLNWRTPEIRTRRSQRRCRGWRGNGLSLHCRVTVKMPIDKR